MLPHLNRAWRVLREEGLRIFWLKLLATPGCYRRMFVLERSLAEPVEAIPSPLPLTIGWLGPADLDDYVALRPSPQKDSIQRRLERGDRCLLARHHGRLVGAVWASVVPPRLSYLNQDLPLAGGEVYLYDAFITPESRGQSVAPLLGAGLMRHYRAAGCRRAVRATLVWNEPALRAHAKSGFHPCAVIGRVKIGPWQRNFIQPMGREAATPS